MLALNTANAQISPADVEGEQFFLDKIEPLLKAHCLDCHSHAADVMEGDLTLDSRSGWEQGGGRGAAIVPGKPEESLLIKAVHRDDPDLKMPPDEKLTAANIELFVQWIQRGAPDPRTAAQTDESTGDPLDWWSLRSLQRPDVPGPAGSHPIDAFVRQQLEQHQLTPAPQADRRTLIRRVTFDLHGLPPTAEAVTQFVADPNPLAFEKLVDRLLESERYGERWARHWLDTVHFADSHGCEHDVFRPNAWRYRDYVIASLNHDIPWDRFIREQLAADRFYPEDVRLTTALGFIAAGPLELSRASTAPVTFDYLDRDDMVGQTMTAFASTTANCARCHDHKFDPITQEDYYALQAVFAGTGKGDVEFEEDRVVANERRRWKSLLAAADAGDRATLLAPEYAAAVAEWEQQFAAEPTRWELLSPATFVSSGGATMKCLEDNSLLASGNLPDIDTYTITAPTGLQKLTALRLEVLADDSLPMLGPGRHDNGNLHLSEFEVSVTHPADGAATDSDDVGAAVAAAEPVGIKIHKATADFDQAGWTIAHAIDGDAATAWGIHPQVGQSHHAIFELQQPVELKPGSQIIMVLKQLHGRGHVIGRLRLSATEAAGATVDVLPELVRSAVSVPRDQRSEEQQAAIAAHALRLSAEKQLAALPALPAVYAVSTSHSHGKKLDQPQTPKVVHVLHRGDIEQPGEVAVPGALSAITAVPGRFLLPDANDEGSRRAALADWLAARDNPLTWRSIVNRVWSHHFGRGLCDTPNDFGRMGGVPSHPELLDWLAIWFRDDAKGSLKQLHRLIVLSATYQQHSSPVSSREGEAPAEPGVPNHPGKDESRGRGWTERSEGNPGVSSHRSPTRATQNRSSSGENNTILLPQSVDAENRWLWRMNRQRLDAESFRDAVLQISGRIDLTMRGPGIQQFTMTTGSQLTPKLHYDAFDWDSPAAGRRSIYRVVWRGITDPFMESLDFPDLGQLAPQRGDSVSALQALTFFNNDFVLHHAQILANQLEASQTTRDDQVAEACRRIWLREPEAEELAAFVSYAADHGLPALCRVLFNSNEFLFVE